MTKEDIKAEEMTVSETPEVAETPKTAEKFAKAGKKSKKHVETFLVNLVLVGIGAYTILACNADSVFIYYYWVIFFGLFNLLRFLQFFTLKIK